MLASLPPYKYLYKGHTFLKDYVRRCVFDAGSAAPSRRHVTGLCRWTEIKDAPVPLIGDSEVRARAQRDSCVCRERDGHAQVLQDLLARLRGIRHDLWAQYEPFAVCGLPRLTGASRGTPSRFI